MHALSRASPTSPTKHHMQTQTGLHKCISTRKSTRCTGTYTYTGHPHNAACCRVPAPWRHLLQHSTGMNLLCLWLQCCQGNTRTSIHPSTQLCKTAETSEHHCFNSCSAAKATKKHSQHATTQQRRQAGDLASMAWRCLCGAAGWACACQQQAGRLLLYAS